MRTCSSQPVAWLALLAICLQVVAGALGGRVCLQPSPAPAAGPCASACCDREGPSDLAGIVGDAVTSGDRVVPDPACCVRVTSDFLAEPTAPTELRASHLLTAVSAAVTPAVQCRPGGSSVVATSGPAPTPPPALVIVRVTVLLV